MNTGTAHGIGWTTVQAHVNAALLKIAVDRQDRAVSLNGSATTLAFPRDIAEEEGVTAVILADISVAGGIQDVPSRPPVPVSRSP
ncbi:MAG: hypothetical protein OXI81_17965 [Paracoccaceae bacterium]|nr:hypothetical protein [Paracoccaceae bacterium]MDE2914074.1 hypothetical protein [Paracoccaceae bacterium]